MNDKESKTAEEKLKEIFEQYAIGGKGLLETELGRDLLKEVCAIIKFKPKAGEVEKLREKFFDECVWEVPEGHMRLTYTPIGMWQWIKDNCLSQSNVVKELNSEELINKFTVECTKVVNGVLAIKSSEHAINWLLSHSHELGKKEISDEEIEMKAKILRAEAFRHKGYGSDFTDETIELFLFLMGKWMRDKLTYNKQR